MFMEISGILNAVFRWFHVIAGVLWIGHLWFFNFVNIPFAAKMKEAGASKTVVPELMPRALFWFRWGAAWTWITGVLLLLLVFYHGGALFEADRGWNAAAIASVVLVFVAPFIYDALFKSPLAGNLRAVYTVAFLLLVAVTLLMAHAAGFTYRGYNIHVGTLLGTTMAFNVWFRIWPSQQKIITAVKAGEAPDAALVTLAGGRSRHNTYMSVPMLWTMINQHTAGTAFSSWGYLGLFAVILVGWHLVFQLYRKSTEVQGF
jgi:uncharacterized membrane protein